MIWYIIKHRGLILKKYLLLTATCFVSVPALAQTQTQAGAETTRERVHASENRTIVVTANYVDDLDLLAGKSVVVGDDLLRDIKPQLADVLTDLPGVSATSFTPGASRPVLRGLQGERVKVLTDGIGALDVSNTSVDHAVTIDPLTTDRVEVFRGPAALLFGSQAIGGAINALDRRIPREIPENGFHVDALGSYSTAFDGSNLGGAVDFAIGDQIVVHVDGSYGKTRDVEVGSFVLTPGLRAGQLEVAAEERAEGHDEEAEEAEEFAGLHGTLPNSGTETYTLGGGFAIINEGGSLGASVSYYDSDYGIPSRPGASHAHGEEEGEEDSEEHGEEPVTIGLKQWRADLRGELLVDGGFVDALRFRVGYSNYEHTEYEGDEVGTIFETQGFEGRFEIVQADRDGWRGVTGFQALTRDFEAIGLEAFVPPNETDQFGIFTVQEFDLGKLGLELSARYERTDVRSDSVTIGIGEDAVTVPVDRNFDAFSVAAGVSYAIAPDIKVGLNASRVERAPSAEELFSNGLHVATQSWEIGDPTLAKEKAWGIEAYLRGSAGPLRFQLAAYHNWFDSFIYEVDTGLEAEELPVYQFFQADAKYWGFEAQAAYDLIKSDELTLTMDAVADYTRATIDGSGASPRIPPFRIGGGLEASAGKLGGRVEVEYVAEQDQVAAFETPTDDHMLVNASISWSPWGKQSHTTFFLSADNIFNVDARRHASFTKDFVPLAGRDFRLSARFSF